MMRREDEALPLLEQPALEGSPLLGRIAGGALAMVHEDHD
jgi:hypothetical protein